VGWIDKYLLYTEKQVSPRLFHFWTAVAVLGGAMERRVVLQVGEDRFVYPGQIIVVLVSKSAVTKKTTAARLGVKFLLGLEPWQCYVLPRKFSPQQLLYGLQRLEPEEKKTPLTSPEGKRVNSAGFMFAGELGTMFTTEPFAEALASHICELNDCPRGLYPIEFRSWKAELWNPCVGGIGCITPKGLARELPKTARTAGFFGRLLIVHASYTDRAVALMDPPSPMAGQLRKELQAELGEIASLRGRFKFSAKAQRWESQWYHDVYKPKIDKMDLPENEQSGYWNRKESHMLEVAMVLAVSETKRLEGKTRHMEAALKHLEQIEKEFPHAFSELHTNPYTDFDQALLAVLERMGDGWVSEQKLRRAMVNQGGDRRFTEARDTLRLAGDIEVKRQDGEMVWRRIYTSGRLLRGATEGKGDEKKKER
jgi:hypothetical protein